MKLEDGTISYDSGVARKDSDSPYLSIDGIKNGWFNYVGSYGYIDYDTMFNKQITTVIDKYAYESTVKDPSKKSD